MVQSRHWYDCSFVRCTAVHLLVLEHLYKYHTDNMYYLCTKVRSKRSSKNVYFKFSMECKFKYLEVLLSKEVLAST